MKKISELNYNLESGKQVNITIVRVFGNEQVAKECDGYKYTETEFKDDTTISIDIPELNIHDRNVRLERKDNMYVVRVLVNARQRAAIVVPNELAEQMQVLTSEKLTDETEPKGIEFVTDEKKAAEYDKLYNEGGEGFNPYRNMINK